MRTTVIRILLPLLALAFIAGASKPKTTVRFHVQRSAPGGSESFTLSAQGPGGSLSIDKVPVLTEKDIVTIVPFNGDDGTRGCYFKLDNHGRLALGSLSAESRGSVLLCFINGRPITALLIDKRVDDGIISIPRGILENEMELLLQTFPLPGQKKPLKAKKERKLTPVEPTPEPIPRRPRR